MFYSYNNLDYICCLLIELLTNSLIKTKQGNSYMIWLRKKG